MNTLHDAHVFTSADDSAPAVIFVASDAPTITVSRREFRESVWRYAHGLKRMGILPRDLVIIAQTQTLEGIYAFWGALLMGAIPSMFPTLTEKLDPHIYMQSMAELVRLSDVKLIITMDDFAPQLAQVVNCPVYGASQSVNRDNEQVTSAWYTPHPSEIAFLQHSSGSTGLQKGVALSHQAVLSQIENYADAIALNSDDVIVSWLPLYHDMGLIAGFIMPLIRGIPLVLMSPFDWVAHPALLFRAIHEHNGTLCWLPNFAYNHCARRIRVRDTENIDLSRMRMFINCSEPVRDDSHRLFLERFAPNGVRPEMLTVSYAMAENTFAVTQTPHGTIPRLDRIGKTQFIEHRRAISSDTDPMVMVSCGIPIRGTEVCVVDEHHHRLPERHIGEIAIKSDYMLTEYYRRPDLQPFTPDGWFLTGDMGYIADGEIYIAGRYKDLIINAGKNVYPQDIEAVVSGVDGIRAGRVVCFGVPDEREGTELIAVVAETDAHPDDHRAIASTIKLTVAQSTTVTVTYVKLVEAGWLIKTSSGKIARSANKNKWMREQKS